MTFSQNNGQIRSINDLHLIENRMIRVFVSSTFLDMAAERKYLIEKTFPKVRVYCQKKNVRFVERDLRWGITSDEANSGKTAEIGLQEIERTHPFFISLLGERYGWIPKPGEIDRRTFEEDRFPWLEQDVLDQRSITEVEMQYGVLRSESDLNAFFYFRSPEMLLRTNSAIRLAVPMRRN